MSKYHEAENKIYGDTNPMPGGCGFSEIVFKEIIERYKYPTSIIELGCGTGGNLAQFGDSRRRVGIDPLEENIVVAKKHNIEAVLGNHKDLSRYRKNQFDVGITLSVLDHIGGKEAITLAVGELLRTCRHLFLWEPYVEGEERQCVHAETKFFRNTWFHDYPKIIKDLHCGAKFDIINYPLYKTNSGPYYHLFAVECK